MTDDLLARPWELEHNVTCVMCPQCAFTFDAEHEDTETGGYSCPLCAESELAAAVRERDRQLEAARTERDNLQSAMEDFLRADMAVRYEKVGYHQAPDGRTIWNGSAPTNRDEWLYRRVASTPTTPERLTQEERDAALAEADRYLAIVDHEPKSRVVREGLWP